MSLQTPAEQPGCRGERQRPQSVDPVSGMRAPMIETTSIMFDVGVIATVGFIGAAFASRARVPIIIGYIIAGMLIGPKVAQGRAPFSSFR